MAKIRRAEKNDLENVIALLENFPSDPEIPHLDWQDARNVYSDLVANTHGLILLSEENGSLAGLITLSFPLVLRFGGEYALVEDFIVDKKFRGQGIGRPLLQAAFKEARDRGCREVQVNGASDVGLPVYIRNGLHEAGKHLKMQL